MLALVLFWQLIVVEVFPIMLSMDKNDFRSLIKHYFLRGKTAKEIKEKLDKYYGANAPSDYTVKYWFREFRGGRNSTTDEVRSGRPSDAVTEDNVKKKTWNGVGWPESEGTRASRCHKD